MGIFRRPPRGWLAGTVTSTGHQVAEFNSHDGEGGGNGGSEIETSYHLDVTWEVRIPGRQTYTLHETRKAPTWTDGNAFGGTGRRWYAVVRLRKTHGLMVGVPIPCAVDPADQTGVWIDWDEGYAAHEVAWQRKSSVDREVAARRSRWDGMWARVADPFADKLDPADQHLVDAQVAAEDAEQERTRAHYAQLAEQQMWGGVAPQEKAAYQAMANDIVRIDQTGRPAAGRIVSVVDTGRVLVGLSVHRLEIDVLDPGPRRVAIEVPLHPRVAKRYQVGMDVRLKVDQADPSKVAVTR